MYYEKIKDYEKIKKFENYSFYMTRIIIFIIFISFFTYHYLNKSLKKSLKK